MRTFIKTGLLIGCMMQSACSELTGERTLSAGTPDPKAFETVAGARGMYFSAQNAATLALANATVAGGLLSDELEFSGPFGLRAGTPTENIEFTLQLAVRSLPHVSRQSVDAIYGKLQGLRGRLSQSLGVLKAFSTELPSSFRAELYALSGFSEIWLADLYCSGIPLSTLDYGGDYTYKAGSTTAEVYTHAVALFDTAIGLAQDSVRIEYFARVGKARALLALGRYAAADSAIQIVPVDFQYLQPIVWRGDGNTGTLGLLSSDMSVANREGIQGYPFRDGQDPRIVVDTVPGQFSLANWYVSRNTPRTITNVVFANGVEAQLVAAEAALRSGSGTWLQLLNRLRTNGTFTTSPHPGNASQIDTLWQAGTGGVAGLKPLVDPGSSAGDSARITVVFNERAAWLFLTGHRQGDLRRLVREDRRSQERVYPVGQHVSYSRFSPETRPYGDDVTLDIPITEAANPLFKGCIDRNA